MKREVFGTVPSFAIRGTYAFFNLPGIRTSIEAFTFKTGGVS